MGSMSRQSRAHRFVGEFKDDVLAATERDREHPIVLAADADGYVRLWVTIGDYEYMSESIIFDPEAEIDVQDFLDDLHGLLGIEETPATMKVMLDRLRKADLL